MASATWRIKLLKLDLALVAKEKARAHKSRPRRLRPRLSAEQLEDRTLPSGGMHLLEHPVHPSPSPPPQGPAAQGAPSTANDGNGQGHSSTPAPQGPSAERPSSPASNANGQGQGNPSNPQGPAGQGSGSPANNGQGHGNSTSDQGQTGQGSPSPAKNDQGENNPQSPQAPTGQEPGVDQQPTSHAHESAAQGPASPANNGQGQNNTTPAATANGQGNGTGQGESENNNSMEAENTQPTLANGHGAGNQTASPLTSHSESENNSTEAVNSQQKLASAGTANRHASPLTSENNGPASESSQGIDSGQVMDTVQTAASRPLASASAAVSSSIGATSAELAQESNAARTFAETLVADESIALGVLAEEGNAVESFAASLRRSFSPAPAENDEVAVPDVGSPSSGGGMPLLIASSPMPSGGAFSAVVTGLQEKPAKDDFKSLLNFLPITDLDRLFLEWWDDDQMLFPDTMPPIDEMLFPEAMPQLDDMLLPNEFPSGEDVSLDLGRLGLVPTAVPTTVRWEDVLASDAPATTQTGEARRFAPTSQPVRARARLESVSATSDPEEQPSPGESLRPYHIALGMMPFLVAIGYTPSSLRDHVHEGQRIWKRLRGYLRR